VPALLFYSHHSVPYERGLGWMLDLFRLAQPVMWCEQLRKIWRACEQHEIRYIE